MFCLFVCLFSLLLCLDVFGSGIRKSLRTCIPKKLSRRLTKTKQKYYSFKIFLRFRQLISHNQLPLTKTQCSYQYNGGHFFAQKIVVIQNKLNNMAETMSPGIEKCLADTHSVQPIDSFRALNTVIFKEL